MIVLPLLTTSLTQLFNSPEVEGFFAIVSRQLMYILLLKCARLIYVGLHNPDRFQVRFYVGGDSNPRDCIKSIFPVSECQWSNTQKYPE